MNTRNCPNCGGEPYITNRPGRATSYSCSRCRHNYSETSKTLRHATKMSVEKWATIEAALKRNRFIAGAARETGVEYKTVWYVAKRLAANG